MSTDVPMMFVCKNSDGSAIERSTWLSAAKLMTTSGRSSAKRAQTASRSQMSTLAKRKFGCPSNGASVERLPA